MTLDQQYAHACMPPRWRICGVRLQPFCLGHALLLQRVNSPLLWAQGAAVASISDLIQALWICSQTYLEARAAMERPMDWRWRFLLRWTVWRLRKRRMLAASRMVMFTEYVKAAHDKPVTERDSKLSRPAYVPDVLLLMGALMGELGYSQDAALSLPYGQAQWEYYAYLDREGAVSFLSEEKQAEREELRRRNEEYRAHPEIIDRMIREAQEEEAKRIAAAEAATSRGACAHANEAEAILARDFGSHI